MSAPPVATAHQAAQAALATGAELAAADLWEQVDWSDPVGSWSSTVADPALVLVASTQAAAAAEADGYVDAALVDLGVDATAEGAVDADGFAAVASDGRDLDGLLKQPVLSAAGLLAAGLDRSSAVTVGAAQLARIVGTQVADAGRVATGAAIAARPQVQGWVRVLTPPSCRRCIPLAGRFYRWSSGFQRHPHDDCIHVPATREVAGDLVTDPDRYFRSLSRGQQDQVFGVADAQAIRDGADLARVVNAHRGMAQSQVGGGRGLTVTTTGVQGERRRRIRLMPESIYAIADGDRAEALRLLRLHGFLL